MKYGIKRLINWFNNLKLQVDWEVIVGFILSGVLSIITVIIFFATTDVVPATESNYEQLEKQANFISQNLNLLIDTDCNINIEDKIMAIEFENAECKIKVKYDENFEVLSMSRKDKSEFMPTVLIGSIFLAVGVFGLGGIVLSDGIILLELAVKSILERIKKKTKC